MSDLLPCPFCGGAAIIDDIENRSGLLVRVLGPDDRVFYSVACGECNALIDQDYWLESEAIAAWNTRALKRPNEPAPDGWKLVPVQPTPEMLEPMAREDCKRDGLDPDEPEPPHGHYPRWYGRCSAYDAMYRAMLAAAPTPPEEMK